MFLKNRIHDTAPNYINMSSTNIFPRLSNLQLQLKIKKEKIGKNQERKEENGPRRNARLSTTDEE